MKHILGAGVLLLGSALAQAQSTHWAFTYTGFYDHEASVFLPGAQISGSFSGVDRNGDGLLERDELTSLLIGSRDYVACAASSATYYCGADSFTFSPGTGLSFSLGEYGGDLEGIVSGGYLVESGKLSYEYSVHPGSAIEHHLYWTDATKLSMSAALVVSSVPESREWTMLAAGLGIVGLWRRRRPITHMLKLELIPDARRPGEGADPG